MCCRQDKALTKKYARRKWAWKIFRFNSDHLPVSPYTRWPGWKLDKTISARGQVKNLLYIEAGVFHLFAKEKDARDDMALWWLELSYCHRVCRVEIVEYYAAGVWEDYDQILARRVRLHKKDWEKALKTGGSKQGKKGVRV